MIYLILFLEFFKIGLFCFGGGFGMIPLIEETVLAHGWLTENEFFELLGICESTPGPIAVNTATYIGAEMGGILGSLCATLGVVLPSFFIILLIASLLKKLHENKHFKGFVKGVQPVVSALILSTGFSILAKTLSIASLKPFSPDLVSIIIFLIILITYFATKKLFKTKLSAVKIIIISAVLGIVISVITDVIV